MEFASIYTHVQKVSLRCLETSGSPFKFKIKFYGFEQQFGTHYEFLITKELNHNDMVHYSRKHLPYYWCSDQNKASVVSENLGECWAEVSLWGRRGGGWGTRPRLWDLHLAPHPSRKGLPLRSSPLLPSQDLFSRAPLPHRMFGVGHWMLASCVLGGDWQQSEGQTPCRMQGGGGGWRCYTNT